MTKKTTPKAESDAKTATPSAAPAEPVAATAAPTDTNSNPEANKAQKKAARTRRLVFGGTIAAVVLSLAACTYCVLDFVRGDAEITFETGANNNAATFTDGASITTVADSVSDSVVSILTETRTTSYWGQDSSSTAAGSGMIISSDGYVLTNKHVIESASSIYVALDDGTTYDDVDVVATDPLSDVAFLKINGARNLSPIALGDSTTLSVGQQVIAIGNALGVYSNTVTSGIISGTGRSITATDSSYSTYETLTDMIQTDAAINAGNSGGPLVNAAGEAIGINTAVSADGDNVGFAIPIASVKGMVKQLLETGSAQRSYLGLTYITLTPEIAEAYHLDTDTGAYVSSGSSSSPAVLAGGPADAAGIKDGDIIVSVNGVEVGAAGSVTTLIGAYAPGDTVQLMTIRDGKERAVNVTLGAYEE